jgi:hypothetical protein
VPEKAAIADGLTQAEKQRRWRDRQLLAGADLNAKRRQVRAEKAAAKATTTVAGRPLCRILRMQGRSAGVLAAFLKTLKNSKNFPP